MSQFDVNEESQRYRLKITPRGQLVPMVEFDGEEANEIAANSIFPSVEEASNFFAKSAVGYSISSDESHFQGMELRMIEWDIKPMKIHHAFVNLYENSSSFPKGTAKLDSAMLMTKLRHEWHRIPIIPAQR